MTAFVVLEEVLIEQVEHLTNGIRTGDLQLLGHVVDGHEHRALPVPRQFDDDLRGVVWDGSVVTTASKCVDGASSPAAKSGTMIS